MLSYQHVYHAGNFADVHKHLTLMLLLEHMHSKPGSFSFYDSHAGRGYYDLASPEAQKTREHETGITAVDEPEKPKTAAARYVKLVEDFRDKHGETAYPGSPAIAQQFMRHGDRMFLTELHPGEFQHLLDNLSHYKTIEMRKSDGLEFVARLTKPHHLRGIVLIDPSYELKTEYRDVARTMMRALNNWSSAIYAVWYPILTDDRHKQMVRSLLTLGGSTAFETRLMAPEDIVGHGMKGSGLIVFNAPEGFAETLRSAMIEMKDLMFSPGAGDHTIVEGQPL
ncbi:23S rRNA (adenine(2030)-N(6))-methyltransferase RlmJ [Kordiimonas aestuarii]|uniref:23S rRNA (adenine(2030)-N(6))-methyltransferase RlmJ n=1 Tax=Kordiimonas aestuarii TaxID=1005925 RepID=UPI0021CFA541|nr:23S rRNA (adenine(2030)-N(6))-methyltransferase RlmJ [Kordiimonas aestuarii]